MFITVAADQQAHGWLQSYGLFHVPAALNAFSKTWSVQPLWCAHAYLMNGITT